MKAIARAALPVAAFALIGAAHVAWHAFFPEQDPAQDRWAPVATIDWRDLYLRGQWYWLAYAYGISGAFASVALRQWWERRQRRAGGLALGSTAASGLFAAASCWLMGCCGSPMLGVYLALLGPAFLPFAKPAVAALTTVSIGVGLWWLGRAEARPAECAGPCACAPSPLTNAPARAAATSGSESAGVG